MRYCENCGLARKKTGIDVAQVTTVYECRVSQRTFYGNHSCHISLVEVNKHLVETEEKRRLLQELHDEIGQNNDNAKAS